MKLKKCISVVMLVIIIISLLFPVARARSARAQEPATDTNSDIVLVIDHSGSMEENDPRFLRLAAAKLFVDLADPGDKIGVVVMSGASETRWLTKRLEGIKNRSDIEELKGQIDDLRKEPMGEETHMGTALTQAYEMLETTTSGDGVANERQFVVMLSDGLPTGTGQVERVGQAVGQFQERRYRKIFSIALGAESDPDYLRQSIAEPLGAAVIYAEQASDLLDSYLDIYTLAGDDRFIDRVTIQPNTLEPLAQVLKDHLPSQVSVVLVRNDKEASIRTLLAPGDNDLLQPYYENTIQRSDEPEYELYTVLPEAQVDLVGDWEINVTRPDDAATEVVVLSRSQLSLQLSVPAPAFNDDDSSIRYHPQGRPLFLVTDIQKQQTEERVTGLTPSAQIITPEADVPVTIADEGGDYDAKANDGRYSGLYPPLFEAGDYTVQLEAPHQTETSIHVRKDYTVRVTSLPTMTLNIPPVATMKTIHIPFEGVLELPGRADFEIASVDFPIAFVERPDGDTEPLKIEAVDEGRYQFTYTPSFSGNYWVIVAAEVQGRGPMGQISYVDYAEAHFAVPEELPRITIDPAFNQTLTYNQKGVLHVPLSIDNESSQEEQLTFQIEGSDGADIVPAEITLNPNEEVRRTIAVHLPNQNRAGTGRLTLAIAGPDDRAIVQSSRIGVPFRKGTFVNTTMISVLSMLGIAAWMLIRRHRRRARAQNIFVTHALRRHL